MKVELGNKKAQLGGRLHRPLLRAARRWSTTARSTAGTSSRARATSARSRRAALQAGGRDALRQRARRRSRLWAWLKLTSMPPAGWSARRARVSRPARREVHCRGRGAALRRARARRARRAQRVLGGWATQRGFRNAKWRASNSPTSTGRSSPTSRATRPTTPGAPPPSSPPPGRSKTVERGPSSPRSRTPMKAAKGSHLGQRGATIAVDAALDAAGGRRGGRLYRIVRGRGRRRPHIRSAVGRRRAGPDRRRVEGPATSAGSGGRRLPANVARRGGRPMVHRGDKAQDKVTR